MKQKANLIAAGAFVLGLVGFHLYAQQLRAEVQGGEPVAVLVVAEDLNPGTLLTEENVAVASIPSDYVDARRIGAEEKNNLLGVPVQVGLHAGEGLVWSDLADGAAHKHLAALVSPGHRAYTLGSDVNPLGRLLRVADHVDVILEEDGRSAMLLQRVLVLAVGGRVEREDSQLGEGAPSGSGVTLSVTPEQARVLLTAESRGELRLVLRNPEDLRQESKKKSTTTAVKSTTATETKKKIEHVR